MGAGGGVKGYPLGASGAILRQMLCNEARIWIIAHAAI